MSSKVLQEQQVRDASDAAQVSYMIWSKEHDLKEFMSQESADTKLIWNILKMWLS